MEASGSYTTGLGRHSLLGLVVLSALMVGMAACVGTETSVSTPVVPTQTAVPVYTVTPTVVPTAGPLPVAREFALTWWTPEFFSPKAPQPASSVLAEQIAAFEASQDGDVVVIPVLKARYGKGGLLDMLRTAQPVAAKVLPDLVVLDIIELEQAAASGLLQPLDGLLAPELIDGLYPFAASNGRFAGRLLAVQFAADLEHLVYLKGQIDSPPATWPAFIAARLPYLFPISGVSSSSVARPQEALAHAVISQYLSAGAVQDPDDRGLRVEPQPLLRLLSFYATAAQSGLLPPAALEVGDAETVWNVYAQSTVPLACVSARHYLSERETLKAVGYAATPGYDAPARSVVSGWALAIVTPDPIRQQAAADLIAWLLEPQNAAAWSQAAAWLPTSPQALAEWGATPYFTFLDEQLAIAISHPMGSDYSQAGARIQRAVVSVVKGEVTPEQAVEAALAP